MLVVVVVLVVVAVAVRVGVVGVHADFKHIAFLRNREKKNITL